MATHKADVAVVGTGPGGYVAAIRCAQLGLSVAAVEDDRPGGVCLNWGCIPTKALLRNAEVVSLFGRAAEFGIRIAGFEASYAEAVQRSRRVADRMSKGVEFLFRKNKITLVPGRGVLKARDTVEVAGTGGTETIQAKAVILATGSEPKSLPGVPIDEKTVLSSNGAVRNEQAPQSIIVIGAGAVGVEFADVYAAYGVRVTILEALPRLVPIEDEEVSKELTRVFRGRGRRGRRGDRGARSPPARSRQRALVHLLPPPDRVSRPDRSEGARERARGERGQVPVHGERQGRRPRRHGGLREGRGRQDDGRDPGRAHHRPGGDRDHPRVRGGTHARGDARGDHPRDPRPPDPVRGSARGDARRARPGDPPLSLGRCRRSAAAAALERV